MLIFHHLIHMFVWYYRGYGGRAVLAELVQQLVITVSSSEALWENEESLKRGNLTTFPSTTPPFMEVLFLRGSRLSIVGSTNWCLPLFQCLHLLILSWEYQPYPPRMCPLTTMALRVFWVTSLLWKPKPTQGGQVNVHEVRGPFKFYFKWILDL